MINILRDYSKLGHDYASFLVMQLDFEQIPSSVEVNPDYSINVRFPDYAKNDPHDLFPLDLFINLPPLDHEFVDYSIVMNVIDQDYPLYFEQQDYPLIDEVGLDYSLSNDG